MRLRLLLIGLNIIFLFMTGFTPGGLPFVPNARFSDAVTTHWPSALYLRESVLQRHTFPLWRDTILAGQPFAANPLNKTAYPLQWLVLLFPPAIHLNLMIALHLLIAGLGMWRWARILGMREEAAAFSALTYTLTPKLIAHLGAGHLDILYALAWWPWLLWSVRRGFLKREHPVATVLRTALFAALVLLADLRLSLFALSIAAVYEIAGLTERSERKQIYRRLLIVVPFFFLTASVLAPLLAWQPNLSRGDLTPAEAGIFSLEWPHLLGLVLPAHTGNFETLTYLGLPALGFGLAALVVEPRKHALWLALLVFAGLYTLGSSGPLWPVLVRLEPGLLWFRVPSRAWFTVALIMSLLAGYGFQHFIVLVERVQKGAPFPLLNYARLVTVAGLWAAIILGIIARALLPIPETAALSVLVWGPGLGILLLAALSGRLKVQFFALTVIILTFGDLAWTGRQWLEWRTQEQWLTPHQPLAERLLAEHAERIYSPTYSLEQQVAAAYELRLFGGVDPFQLSGVVKAIEQGSGVPSQGYSVILPPLAGVASDDEIEQANRSATLDTEVLAAWRVSHVVAAYPLVDNSLQLLDVINGVYLYSNENFISGSLSRPLPDWPADIPGLPDAAAIAQLDRMTISASLVSGISFMICLGVLIYLRRKTNA